VGSTSIELDANCWFKRGRFSVLYTTWWFYY